MYFHFFLFTIFICTKIGFLVSYFISNLKSIPRASPLLQYKNICNLLFMTPQSAVFNYGYLREHRSSRDCPLVSGSNERYLMKPVEICVATRPKNPSNANIIFCHTFCVCCKLRIELNRNLVSSSVNIWRTALLDGNTHNFHKAAQNRSLPHTWVHSVALETGFFQMPLEAACQVARQ